MPAKRICGLNISGRFAAAEQHVGKRCTVTYRESGATKYDKTETGIVIGPAWPADPGKSTGHLIIQGSWTTRGGALRVRLLFIALANIATIEPVDG